MKHFKIPFTVFVALLLVVLYSCKKEQDSDNLSGTYKGSFIRHSGAPNVDPARATVEITFTKNDFSGNSNLRNYPAICNGSYKAVSNELEVYNGCYFTADFDGTFIFDGTYKYSVNGSVLTIWRDYSDGKRDEYELQKQ